jgi:hypothetical protein
VIVIDTDVVSEMMRDEPRGPQGPVATISAWVFASGDVIGAFDVHAASREAELATATVGRDPVEDPLTRFARHGGRALGVRGATGMPYNVVDVPPETEMMTGSIRYTSTFMALAGSAGHPGDHGSANRSGRRPNGG